MSTQFEYKGRKVEIYSQNISAYRIYIDGEDYGIEYGQPDAVHAAKVLITSAEDAKIRAAHLIESEESNNSVTMQ